MSFDIAGRPVARDADVFVIAEIGVNHDGSVDRAVELVGSAREAGADAVKLQLFRADRLVHASATAASYQVANCGAVDQASLLSRFELTPGAVAKVVEAIRSAGLVPIATPFSIADVELIESLDLPAIKLASPDLVNLPLLDRAMSTGRPLLLSTGAATLDEIDATVSRLETHPFALLHCVSAYPTPVDAAHLSWVNKLENRFPALPIGYSDHTDQPMAGALAVAAGARVIEKHLTWNRDAIGPDHRASFDPSQFADYVQSIRTAQRLLGSGTKRVLPIEDDVRRLSRQSLVLARNVEAGQSLQRDDLEVRRPGTGIPAASFEAIVGRQLRSTHAAGTLLAWDMLDEAAA